ncbi:hypothetical protein SEF58_12845 [Neomoorella humiferrea]|uniref:hypothetical protein n=1 Tax=Neomoorella humiferrea TaxID=676965 RepID=UPI003D8D28DB
MSDVQDVKFNDISKVKIIYAELPEEVIRIVSDKFIVFNALHYSFVDMIKKEEQVNK